MRREIRQPCKKRSRRRGHPPSTTSDSSVGPSGITTPESRMSLQVLSDHQPDDGGQASHHPGLSEQLKEERPRSFQSKGKKGERHPEEKGLDQPACQP